MVTDEEITKNYEEIKDNFYAFVDEMEKFKRREFIKPARRARVNLLKVYKRIRLLRRQIEDFKPVIRERKRR